MYKVSILLAVYNSEKYLSEAIESVLSQTYRNIELVIVLNGCTDNSLEIAKHYALINDNVKLFIIKEKGKNIAYNKAFLESTGDLFCFFAADDILSDKNIELRVNPFLFTYKHRIFTTICLKSFSDISKLDSLLFPKNPSIPNYSGGSIMFCKESASHIFPLPSFLPNEDTYAQCILRLIAENIHIPEYLYLYRLHVNNSYSSSLMFHEKKIGFLKRMKAFDLVKEKSVTLPIANKDYLNDVYSISMLNSHFFSSLFSIKVFLKHKIVFLANTFYIFYFVKNFSHKFFSGLFKQL